MATSASCRRENNSLGEPGHVITSYAYKLSPNAVIPCDDALSARKLRRPAALLVAALSSCGKKANPPGGPPVEKVVSRKNDFFTLGEYAGLDLGVSSNAL